MVSVTLAGCSEAWPVGVTLRDGRVAAVFPICDNQLVTKVDLVVQEPTRKVLWEIRSDAGSRQTDYVVGEAPPGFVTVVPLSEPLPSGVLFLGVEATEPSIRSTKPFS